MVRIYPTRFVFVGLTCVTFYIILKKGVSDRDSSFKPPGESDQDRLQNDNLDSEVVQILNDTPYLWRKFNLSENDTALRRVRNQQQWIQRLAGTEYMKSQDVKAKVIWIEDSMSLFYWSKDYIYCPYSPSFQDKCILKKLSFFQRLLGPQRYPSDGEAIISIRDWDSRTNYKIDKNVYQILRILEPPLIAKDANIGLNNAIIATYSRSSDIPVPYMMFVPQSQSNDTKFGLQEVDFISKTEMIAAIISNCESKDRLEYIEELNKYTPVHVYGKCGEFDDCYKSRNQECLKFIEERYKFFLAFENSRCEDYITEKLFDNALGYNIVPIVRGSRPEDYKAAAPPNSYIDANDFPSPKELGEYLVYLSKDWRKYNKYLEWKGSGYFTQEQFLDFFCRVCGMLFYADFVPPPKWRSNKDTKDIEWKDVNKCLPSDIRTRW